jgi:GAF domain-containing protein
MRSKKSSNNKKAKPRSRTKASADTQRPTYAELRQQLAESLQRENATATENVRLFQELQERNRDLTEALEQQTATTEVLKVISRSTFDLQPVLQTLVENATRLCGAETGFIARPDGNVLRMAVGCGTMAKLMSFYDDNPAAINRGTLLGRTFLERRTVHVEDVLADPEYQWTESQKVGRYRTMLGVPLLRERGPLGIIGMWREEVRPFTAKEIELVTTFADQAVIAIENVRLLQELQNRNRDLTEALEQQTATSEILSVIASSPTDIQPVLDTVVESAARLCEATDAVIHRFDGTTLWLVAHYGPIPLGVGLGEKVPSGRGVVHGRAIADRQTIHVHDIAAEIESEFPDSKDLQERTGTRTILATPMLREGVPIGAIVIRRTEVRPFNDKQIALLKTFADQAVIAIENVRLFRELQERNRDLTEALEQQTATSEILRVLASSPTELEPVLNAVIESAVRLAGAKQGYIRQYDGEFLPIVSHYNMRDEDVAALKGMPLRPGRETGPGHTFLERRPIHIPDLEADQTYLRAPVPIRTFLGVPMLREGNPIGIIAIWSDKVKPFTARQIDLVTTFADQAVIAIENVRLFKELQERNAELREALEHQTATSEVLGIISRSPTDVQPVLDAIVESAARVCGIDDVVLRLRDGNAMIPRAHFGPIPIGPVRSIDTPQFRWMREHGTLHVHDVSDQDEFPTLGTGITSRTLLIVPLRQQEEPIGTLTARRTEVRPFTPAQVKLLETFADQALIALENVRLFQELKESLEQQTATSEILGVIASSPTDIQPVLKVVAKNAARLCDAVDALITRPEGDSLRVVAQYGDVPVPEYLPLSRSFPAGRAVIDRQTIHIDDIAAQIETDYPEARVPQQMSGTRTVLNTPLLREGVAIGGIGVRRTEVRPFTEKQIALLKTFADQAVIAIENVRLFKEIQERNAELREALEHQTATAEVLGIISRSPTDVQPVLDAIVESAARVCGIDDVVLRLHEGNNTVPRAHFGPMPINRIEISTDEPRFRWLREHGTLHVPDVRERNELQLRPVGGWRTLLSVPLRQQGELIGSLNARRIEVRPFTPAQIKLLETFAIRP